MEIGPLAAIIDFLPDATFAIDRGGHVIVWNRAMESMTGVHREDMLGKSDYAYSIPFYGKRRPILIDFVMPKGKKPEVSYDYIKREGNIIYAETYVPALNNGMGAYLWGTAGPLLDDNGGHQGAIESIRDITNHKQVGESLAKSKAKLRNEQKFSQLLLNTSPAYIVAIGFDRKTLMMNQVLLDAIEYTTEEIKGTDYLNTFVPEEDRQAVDRVFQQIINEGIATVSKSSIRSRSGRTYHVEWHGQAATYEKTGFDFFIGVGIDITQRKLTEKLLEEQRRRFLVLTDEAPFGIVLINSEGRYAYINAKFREIFGYNLHDIPDGKTWFRKAYPDAGYRHKAIETWLSDVGRIAKDASRKQEGKWTFTVTCKDNTEKTISFITHRLQKGEYLMTCEDVTERKKTEETLEKREAELEIKSTNLEEMNAALKVLLKERENDKIKLEEKILSNMKELVFPYIEKLKKSRLDSQHMTYVDIVETNLNDIVSPFLQKMGLKYTNLTPTEIEIANLIKNGKSTKEIGELLHISSGTINFHRNNIRKKLGLNNEKVNLRSFLMSLQ